jgi:hypothetical protein
MPRLIVKPRLGIFKILPLLAIRGVPQLAIVLDLVR